MGFDRSKIRSVAAATSAARLALALLLGATLLATAQSHRARHPASPPAVKRPTPDAIVPFAGGEQLSFRVLWSKYAVNAGTISFSVVERRDFFGRAAWHFRGVAQTVQTMRIVYPLDDQFDSYTDTVQLTSLQYEMYLHEQGKQQNDAWRMSADGAPAPPNMAAARVPAGTRDPISLLYVLRAVDWTKTLELRTPVFDGHHLYDVVARLEQSSDQVTVPAGQFAASKIDVHVSEHGQEVAGTHFSLWLASDASRTPVLIEAELPVGTARVELTGRP